MQIDNSKELINEYTKLRAHPEATEPNFLSVSVPTVLSPENIPEVSTCNTPSNINDLDNTTGYTLPFRQNHGMPPNRYSPEIENEDRSI